MKLPKEMRRLVNKARSRDGKKNGVVRYIFEGRWAMQHLVKPSKRKVERDVARRDSEEC
jgi:hypothetical protein